MADAITNPSPPAGGSHRTVAVIVILTALILAALIWVSTQGRNNQISDRVGTTTTPPATGTASGVTSGGTGSQAGTSPSDATQPGGNQSTDDGQPVTGH
jgi:hypothetical protein